MGPGFGSFPRGSSYPSLFLPYCCKYFNKTEKEKKKDKKKVRKSHHLKPPGTCSPGPRTFSGTEQRPALATRTSCIVHPSQGGQPPEPLLHSREQQRNKEPVLPGTGSRHLCSVSPASVRPPGACTSLPAPLARRHPHTQRCFCRDGCITPLSSCFSYITSGLTAGRRRLASHPEKGKGKE